MSNPGKWTTSVNELMHVFRDSLRSLVPCMERAKIAWREPDAYDDWDDIAQALYENIVVRSIEYSLGPKGRESMVLPEYGMLYPLYDDMSFIELVLGEPRDDQYNVFLDFATADRPFDTARYVVVLAQHLNRTEEPRGAAVESANFAFVKQDEHGHRKRISSISVEL